MSFYANICGTLNAAETIRNGGRIMNRKESFALRVKSAIASTFRGIFAGAAIALGGTVYLMAETKLIGAIFFAIGLFMVCTLGLNLFTGKACSTLDAENKLVYHLYLVFIWAFNFVGA